MRVALLAPLSPKLRLRLLWSVLVLSPVLGFIWLGTIVLLGQFDKHASVINLRERMSIILRVGNLVHQLQMERGLSVGLAAGDKASHGLKMSDQRKQSDLYLDVVADFQRQQKQEWNLSPRFKEDFIFKIQQIRTKQDHQGFASPRLITEYSDLIGKLVGIIEFIVEQGDAQINHDIHHLMDAYLDFLKGKEAAGIEGAETTMVIVQGKVEPATMYSLVRHIAAQETNFSNFIEDLPSQIATPFRQRLSQYDEKVVALRHQLLFSPATFLSQITSTVWFDRTTGRLEQQNTLALETAGLIQQEILKLENKSREQLLFYIFGGLLLLGLSLWTLLRLFRLLDDSENGYAHLTEMTANLEGQVVAKTASLRQEMDERRQAEMREARLREAQTVISSLLRLAMEPLSLRESMEKALSIIFSLSWLSVQSKGSVFVKNNQSEYLVMVAWHGISEAVVARCGRLAMGVCLCGRAASQKQLIYAQPNDPRHEIDANAASHGHYCLPLLRGDDLLGVLNLYVAGNHQALVDEEDFLHSVADTLSGVMHHYNVEHKRHMLARVVEQSPVSVVITDREGSIEYVNQHFTQVTGYTREEAMGKTPRLLKSGHYKPEVYRKLWDTITQGHTWQGEFQNKRKDGSIFWEWAVISPMRGQDNELSHYVAVKEEISARKEAEAREKRSQEAQQVIVELLRIALQPISLVEQLTLAFKSILDSQFLPCNTYGTLYLRSGQGDDLLLVVQQGFPDDHFTECRTIQLGKCYCSRAASVHQAEFVTNLAGCDRMGHGAMGGRHLFSLPMESRGELWGILNFFLEQRYRIVPEEMVVFSAMAATLAAMVDRERILNNQQRALADKEKAVAMERAKDAFLANMSHEIRTPMNGVMGMLELMQNSGLLPRQKQMVTLALESAENLLNILNDLLDFSKIQAGKMHLEQLPFALHELVESAVGQMAGPAHKGKLELSCFIPAELATQVKGDPTRLRQVLLNLLSNAVKFTAKGEVAMRVVREEEIPGGHRLRFEVTDTGIGLNAEQLSALFQPFSQADTTTTRRFGGTGLGLAICKQLVELMGGEIGVASAVGEGSTFWFTLPLMVVGDLPPPLPLLAGTPCLVVEGHPTNRGVLEGYLKEMGMVPISFGLGQKAWEHVQTMAAMGQRFPYALLDMHMADMDGLALARRIKSVPIMKESRIFILSDIENLQNEPGDETIARHLVKPVRRVELRAAITGTWQAHAWGDPSPERHLPSFAGRVLVVDDNAMNRQVALGMLATLGLRAEVAINGAEALRVIDGKTFDLILMDMQMPEMDGLTATKHIRELELGSGGKSSVIVAMTANARNQDRQACLVAGMDDYLTKPVTLGRLREVLDKYLMPANQPIPGDEPPTGRPGLIFQGVNRQTLAELGETMSVFPDGFAGVVRSFLAEAPKLMIKLNAGLAKQDAQQVRRTAHTLKSNTTTLGAPQLAALIAQVEEIARHGPLEGVDSLLRPIDLGLAAMVQELRELLQQTETLSGP